jgi:hypothetical protein
MSVEEKVANGKEVLADVGRLGARWILWSRKRLGLTLAAVLLVGLGIGQLTGPVHPGGTSKPPVAATSGNDGISAGGDGGRLNAIPTPFPVDHSPDVAAATHFVDIWLSHAPAGAWLPAVQALSTPQLAAGFVGVDPKTIPGTKRTGPATWSDLGVVVPTDHGSVLVVVVPSSGLVDDITPASG